MDGSMELDGMQIRPKFLKRLLFACDLILISWQWDCDVMFNNGDLSHLSGGFDASSTIKLKLFPRFALQSKVLASKFVRIKAEGNTKVFKNFVLPCVCQTPYPSIPPYLAPSRPSVLRPKKTKPDRPMRYAFTQKHSLKLNVQNLSGG